MAVRAVSSYTGQHDATNTSAVHQQAPIKFDINKRLQIKSKCKNCDKVIQKFKMRYGKLRQFDLCIECWRAKDSNKNKDNNSALFDVVCGVSTSPSNKPSNLPKVTSRKPHIQPLPHHIFDGSYGWMIKDSKSQPSMNWKLSINQSDFKELSLPIPDAKSSKVKVITDTGAQSSLMGIKAFRNFGFDEALIVPAKKKMFAVNSEGINKLGAFIGRLCGHDKQGHYIEAPEMIYVTDSIDLFYLSRQGMENLKIIPTDFPSIGAAASIASSANPDVPAEARSDHVCECLPRNAHPPRPSELSFEPTEAKSDQMKQWLLERFASSTFNQCSHQPLPMIKGPAVKIHVDPDATPSAVHTPAQVPIHWRDTIKKQLQKSKSLPWRHRKGSTKHINILVPPSLLGLKTR